MVQLAVGSCKVCYFFSHNALKQSNQTTNVNCEVIVKRSVNWTGILDLNLFSIIYRYRASFGLVLFGVFNKRSAKAEVKRHSFITD